MSAGRIIHVCLMAEFARFPSGLEDEVLGNCLWSGFSALSLRPVYCPGQYFKKFNYELPSSLYGEELCALICHQPSACSGVIEQGKRLYWNFPDLGRIVTFSFFPNFNHFLVVCLRVIRVTLISCGVGYSAKNATTGDLIGKLSNSPYIC